MQRLKRMDLYLFIGLLEDDNGSIRSLCNLNNLVYIPVILLVTPLIHYTASQLTGILNEETLSNEHTGTVQQ